MGDAIGVRRAWRRPPRTCLLGDQRPPPGSMRRPNLLLTGAGRWGRAPGCLGGRGRRWCPGRLAPAGLGAVGVRVGPELGRRREAPALFTAGGEVWGRGPRAAGAGLLCMKTWGFSMLVRAFKRSRFYFCLASVRITLLHKVRFFRRMFFIISRCCSYLFFLVMHLFARFSMELPT